ncbi:Transient receptor putative-gamma protein [Clonorchis sinensis]|uniref:Transient receptor putative-gamma protein n=1 Tax=Clonorchis sinensis TaxID=79923 RepID=A0A419Q0G4_CLOSI|nr:Transient receptor putative-gamma protein [Clonorchis sinensis]
MSPSKRQQKYTLPEVVDVVLFRHQALKKRPKYRARNASPEQIPNTSTGMTIHEKAGPRTEKRRSTRRSSSVGQTTDVRTLNFREVGEFEKDEVRKEVNDVIAEVESDLAGRTDKKSGRRAGVVDLGGLELPLEEGELSRAERCFLHAAESGDLGTLKELLDRTELLNFNPNCTDALGRDALRIVIENEHLELLDLLVHSPLIDLKDSLLHAINEDNTAAVEVILQAQTERACKKNLKGLLGRIQSSSFTPDITPIILAAHRDNYMILKLLLDRGDRIPKPHDLRCSCHNCVQARRTDGLQHSKLRINAFRALTSPSFIILTSNDPILTAFEMSYELRQLGELENEFRTDYEELSEKCETFATELLGETRSSVELSVILNHDTGSGGAGMHVLGLTRQQADDSEEEYLQLPRLKLAIKYEQKKFVAHPHCQQLLASMWYDGLPGFRQKPMLAQLTTMGTLCAMFPVLATCYMLAPRSKPGGLMKKPFIKFLCHSSAYLSFLGLLLLAAVRIESLLTNTMDERMNDRAPWPSLSEAALVVYVLGFLWQEIKKVYTWGFRAYISDMWHLLDFIMISMYISTIAMRTVAIIRVQLYNEDRFVNRGQWDSFDPILISECLFAGANIVSTLKLVYVFTVSPQLGPLQISLGRMLYDIFKFFCVYVLVIVAFAFGLNQLFWFYANNRARNCKNVHFTLEEGQKDVYDYCITRGTHFTNLFEIAQSLYWSSYGLIDLTSFNLEYPHAFTEFVGKLTFGVYSYIAFIVLLNMLIAMMNSSYEQIVQQVDVEWKFARSKLWISYFVEGCTVPVPFNLVPTPKSFMYMMQFIKNSIRKCCHKNDQQSEWDIMKKYVKMIKEREARYMVVMRELTKRYIMKKLRAAEFEPVGADDLNEIKGDISAFRFELLDILKANGMNIPMIYRKTGKLRKNRDGLQTSDYEDISSFKETLLEKAKGVESKKSATGLFRATVDMARARATMDSLHHGGPVENPAFVSDEPDFKQKGQTVECVSELEPFPTTTRDVAVVRRLRSIKDSEKILTYDRTKPQTEAVTSTDPSTLKPEVTSSPVESTTIATSSDQKSSFSTKSSHVVEHVTFTPQDGSSSTPTDTAKESAVIERRDSGAVKRSQAPAPPPPPPPVAKRPSLAPATAKAAAEKPVPPSVKPPSRGAVKAAEKKSETTKTEKTEATDTEKADPEQASSRSDFV